MLVAVRGRCCILLLYQRATRLVRRRGEVRSTDPPTFRFSGRTYPQLARIVRVLCTVGGRCCLPLVAAVAVSLAQSIGSDRPRSLQGMACVRSGQAAAWPLVSGRSVRSGSGVKRDFACTSAGAFPPLPFALRAESRLMLEGRTRTLSGPSAALSPARTLAP